MSYSVWGNTTVKKAAKPQDDSDRRSVSTTADPLRITGIPHNTKTRYNYVKIDEHK